MILNLPNRGFPQKNPREADISDDFRDWGVVDAFKKGGKVKKRTQRYTQKQKQSTNIKINIGGGHGKEEKQSQPRIITQYVGSNPTQPINLNEVIKGLNSIENKIQNQKPINFNADVLKQDLVSTLEGWLSGKEQQVDSKEEAIPSSSSASASSSSAPASSSTNDEEKLTDTGVDWQGVSVFMSPNGTLKYTKHSAGSMSVGYLSAFVGQSKPKRENLGSLYANLDKSGFKDKYKKL